MSEHDQETITEAASHQYMLFAITSESHAREKAQFIMDEVLAGWPLNKLWVPNHLLDDNT
jgi:hypothetical protein